ncbi:DUF192 domain-containing protein [Cellulophaga sp. Z1A5H]|uniref:DUF192 domain-containing protein n=1 Tax=Cellulophaga sp. Z1A5H TaxID=2687291 RepID=UPI0013FD16ED|nr:DUF192 domain-containing protein [Cellulophaga sp. Z1A5H]
MKITATLLTLTTLCLFLSCKEEAKQAIETPAITFKKEGELTIYKAKTDSIIASFDIEIAETDYETETGLMYRKSMKANHGMLFVFPDVALHSFYMKNTEIPLDIIYLTENLKIASFQENAIPFNESGLSSQVPIKYVLEINAGLAEKYLLEVKDSVVYKKL